MLDYSSDTYPVRGTISIVLLGFEGASLVTPDAYNPTTGISLKNNLDMYVPSLCCWSFTFRRQVTDHVNDASQQMLSDDLIYAAETDW